MSLLNKRGNGTFVFFGENNDFMIVSRVDAPLVTKNELNGIIYKLNNTYKTDLIKKKLVIPSSFKSIHTGIVRNLVEWRDIFVTDERQF